MVQCPTVSWWLILTSSGEEIRKHSDVTTDCNVHFHDSHVTHVVHLGMKSRMLFHHQHQQPLQRHQKCVWHLSTTPHTTTILRPYFRDHPGEPVPEEYFWTLWCKRRLTKADTLTIRLGTTPSVLTSANLHHHQPPVPTSTIPTCQTIK